jgi:hypothetical protein
MKRAQKKRHARQVGAGVAFAEHLSRTAKDLAGGANSEVDIIDRLAMMLLLVSTHAMSTNKPMPLVRVHATLGVLRSMRGCLRFLNGEGRTWAGDEEVFPKVEENANILAEAVLASIAQAHEEQHAVPSLFANWYGFPAFRADLRFFPADQGDKPVPFGHELPEFDFEDVDWDVINRIDRDVREMSTTGMTPLQSKDDIDTSTKNATELLISIVAIGKCVMCGWSPTVQAFLDFLACKDVDSAYDQGSS